MLKSFLTFIGLMSFVSIAQDSTDLNLDHNDDSLTYERFLDVIENSIRAYNIETWGKDNAYQIIEDLGYAEDDKPDFSDSIYKLRLNTLNASTIIDIEDNEDVIKTLKYFIRNRRTFTAICLGRSKMFFPMYEQYLDKYEIPMELKYLSVIESGLRPTVKSRVGAAGLWQFMYRTGRMFGLETDSYVDERMNPEMATDAACRYLKYLYGLYGDWSLALAAYNAGPGNVNKAIRRSGGKMNYWELRPFLPKETQMYVPNFIAMLYMMTYYADHNITAKEAQVYLHDVDTVCVKSSFRISHLDTLLGITKDEFNYLNPVYKTDIVPQTMPYQCITLPIEKIDSFLFIEDSLYAYDKFLESIGESFVALEKKKTHVVKPDQRILEIAEMYDVTVSDIKGWNGLRSSTIYPGQRLTIRVTERRYIEKSEAAKIESKPSSSHKSSSTKTVDDGKYEYYTLRSGESLWTVSQKFGISFVDLQALNKGLDPKRMQPGDKIKIKRL
ncbi:lytic transglycosylase domain-containing protein [Crocinitomix catalasitica]|uniref:lytic transglycosylase domain-containing protein n=1 Tax=Crocinitomix catalasitica TaxID=184607 RepID=UPI000A026147|nr:lytic transglycosylase domain-containing protein [Crocinitomix catalasitica]